MHFNFTDEQEMLRDSLARFLREKYDFETRTAIIASDEGWSREIWGQLAEMGLMAVAFPEEYDGLDGNGIDTMVIMEEFGKALLVEPYLASVVLAGGLLKDAGGPHAKELIPQIAAGAMVAGFGFAEPRSRFDLFHVETIAEPQGDGFVLNGHKAVVLAGSIADRLIISARTSGKSRDRDGISLFVINPKAPGVTLQAYPTIDGLQAADVIFENVQLGSEALLGEQGKALASIEKIIDQAIAAISAEAMGMCRRMVELTQEFCQTRQQFGQPLSKFQVLQHRMVDMLIYTEEMTSMAYMAAAKLESPTVERAQAAAAAKVQLGKSCIFVGESAVQLHGGMGITEEMAIGHYFMHGTMLELLFGNTEHYMKRYETVAGLRPNVA